jgi:hypothetical protein
MAQLNAKSAVQAINKNGCLLVFPLNNRPEPKSIWSSLFPRSKMKWEWDQDGDTRVHDLWNLREQLSRSRKVIYSKWYQGRATFFSPEVFVNLMSYLGSSEVNSKENILSHESRGALEILEMDSPLSTKMLKAACELEGRLLEPTYNRALKPLWQKLLIVGFGEFEDSSFPSLGIGATKTLFEELWEEGQTIPKPKAAAFLNEKLGEQNPFLKFANKIQQA